MEVRLGRSLSCIGCDIWAWDGRQLYNGLRDIERTTCAAACFVFIY